MIPGLRKLVLTAHLTVSVGWIGALVAYLALGVAVGTSRDAQTVRAASLNDIGERPAGVAQRSVEVLDRLPGLDGGVAFADNLAVLPGPRRAGYKDECASPNRSAVADDRLEAALDGKRSMGPTAATLRVPRTAGNGSVNKAARAGPDPRIVQTSMVSSILFVTAMTECGASAVEN